MKTSDAKPPGLQNIPLPKLIPKNQENRHFYENGLTKWIPKLNLRVHSDLEECFFLWEKFSPKESLFDLWDFRYSWYEGYNCHPYFYTIYEGNNPIGVLPLWYSKEKRRYEWFGSNWMEDNSFFVKENKFIDLLLAVAPTPLHLNAIQNDVAEQIKKFGKIINDDAKNTKDLSPYKTIDDLLQTFEKKHRYNLKTDFSKIQEMGPRIVETFGKENDLLEKLIDMNITQFHTGDPEDESDLAVPERAKTYRAIVQNQGVYKVKFIQIYIQNHLAAIDFVLQYKKKYYSIKGGNEVKRFRGIGNYIIYYEFEDAIRNKFDELDCLQIDYGWKHRYFDQSQVFSFEK